MSKNKTHICPVFPEMICPQGEEMSEACSVRMNGNFDPIADFRDHLLLHCALYQNELQAKTVKSEES